MPKALVTGSLGFVGKHLVRYLKNQGYRVTGIDRLMGRESDLSLPDSAGLLDDLVSGCDEVYHLAGSANIRWCEEHPAEAFQDVVMAINVFDACLKHKKPVVAASSAQVYGRTYHPMVESAQPAPRSTYAVVKHTIEQMAYLYRGKDLQVSMARIFNVYGPGQERAVTYKGTVVTDTIKAMLEYPDTPKQVSSWDSVYDFIYVDDIVAGLHLICAHVPQWGREFCYNLGTGVPVGIFELNEEIAREVGFTGELVRMGPGEGPVPMQLVGDNSLLSLLGWKPEVPLREGIRRTVEAFDK